MARKVKFDAFDVDHEQRLGASHQNVSPELEITGWLGTIEDHVFMVFPDERISELPGHAYVVGISESEIFELKQLFAATSTMNACFRGHLPLLLIGLLMSRCRCQIPFYLKLVLIFQD